MAAQTFVLTTTPTLIADGTKAAYIQEIIGSGQECPMHEL